MLGPFFVNPLLITQTSGVGSGFGNDRRRLQYCTMPFLCDVPSQIHALLTSQVYLI